MYRQMEALGWTAEPVVMEITHAFVKQTVPA
jgi:hypothetical protein